MQPQTLLYEYLHELIGGEHHASAGQPAAAESVSISKESAPAGRQQVETTCSRAADHSAGDPGVVSKSDEERPVIVAESPQIPDWAESRFQVLLFSLRGITLGVPLNALDSIVRWNGRSTRLPGQPRWQLGLFLHEGRKIRLVDLASLIMPERMSQVSSGSGYLLLVGGARWGLICDHIQRPIEVCASDISWRRQRQIRPWCFGVIVESSRF